MLVYFLLSIIFGLLILLVYAWREAKKHESKTTEEVAGICAVAFERTGRKSRNKARIMGLLETSAELTNADIRENLGVTRRSIVNYLNELEKEGKVRQIGSKGRFVTYRRI